MANLSSISLAKRTVIQAERQREPLQARLQYSVDQLQFCMKCFRRVARKFEFGFLNSFTVAIIVLIVTQQQQSLLFDLLFAIAMRKPHISYCSHSTASHISCMYF
ncbi:hypothetical protein RB195_020023 [Necator americanus]|uniref:Uncharacterized protein n=1 Tax=Necator americanus TaxID=51031 RepID=A0ABR1CIB3_NECAM